MVCRQVWFGSRAAAGFNAPGLLLVQTGGHEASDDGRTARALLFWVEEGLLVMVMSSFDQEFLVGFCVLERSDGRKG